MAFGRKCPATSLPGTIERSKDGKEVMFAIGKEPQTLKVRYIW